MKDLTDEEKSTIALQSIATIALQSIAESLENLSENASSPKDKLADIESCLKKDKGEDALDGVIDGIADGMIDGIIDGILNAIKEKNER